MEYDIHFGERLASTARDVVANGTEPIDAQRMVLYLSLLSVEISLKAVLEHAGVPVQEIRACSHRLIQLLHLVDALEVKIQITPSSTPRWVAGSRIRSVVVDDALNNATVGNLIEAEGVSQYPNQIRYGEMLRHYPASIMAQLAMEVSEWCINNRDKVRFPGGAGQDA